MNNRKITVLSEIISVFVIVAAVTGFQYFLRVMGLVKSQQINYTELVKRN